MSEEELPEELSGLLPDLEDLDSMQVISVIRSNNAFRVESSGMSTDSVLACLMRAVIYQCMEEFENMVDVDEVDGDA